MHPQTKAWPIQVFTSYGDLPALADANENKTYRELCQDILIISNAIRGQNLKPNSSIALISDYSYDAVVLFFALYLLGHCIVPLLPNQPAELDTKLNAAHCAYKITTKGDSFTLELHTPTSEQTPNPLFKKLNGAAGLILFSSGSTGIPKTILYNLETFFEKYRVTQANAALRTVMILTFDHIGGLDTLFSLLFRGSFICLTPSKNPHDLCKLIQDHKLTFISVSPSFLSLLAASNATENLDLSTLKTINYGAETMPEPLLNRLHTLFPNIKLNQTFGTSETGTIPVKSVSSTSSRIHMKGEGELFKIIDNQLYIKPQVGMIGYLNAENPLTEDGWFSTGDLVERFEDGSLRIIGRHKEMINVGGQKVTPGEVEEALLTIPDIQDAMVYGTPNPLLGQTVNADIITTSTLGVIDLKRLIRQELSKTLDAYKIPTKINLVTEQDLGPRLKKRRLTHG